jgi:hypothetical protein
VYGGKGRHEDGPHYHVKFGRKVHWTDARKNFRIPGDTDAIHIRVPERRQLIGRFLENTQSCCQKDGNPDTFGNRFSCFGNAEANV